MQSEIFETHPKVQETPCQLNARFQALHFSKQTTETLSDAAAPSAVSPHLMRGLALGRAVIEADSFGVTCFLKRSVQQPRPASSAGRR
jgi:hypothetical protein